jgi:large subunit ribosomal protein L29
MAKEKAFDYKQASEADLSQRLQKNQQDLFKLRFRAASAPVKNTMEIRKIRRDIARINTFVNQRRQNP